MTLRARLLLALSALLATALVVSGGLVIGLTRASLVDEIDTDLMRVSPADPLLGPGGGPPDPTGRRFALLIFERDGGRLVRALPSGLPRSPDPLPQMPPGGAAALPLNRIVELPAEESSLRYRVRAVVGRVADGGEVTVVLGAPMSGVQSAIGLLARALLVVGLAVLGLVVLVGWLLIRRDLRPLESMTTTAEQIAAGDLSRRVGVPDDGSEVGRLGHAFDTMLDQIQGAFDSQHSALVAKERSEARLRQFVADASHELRTPLTALRGYAELYRAGGLAEPEALEQAMTRIGGESRRMAALVEDLLLLARLDQGRPLRSDALDLSEVVNDALQDLRAVEPERPINANVEPGLVVRGDEDRLRQVVGNLLANVRMHTAVHTRVDVTLHRADDGLVSLRVADHGPGIDAAHVDRIFDRFYRADAGRSRDRGGSGLGLAIASSVAAAHGGTIAYGPTPGGGATFTLTLPRE